MLSTAMDEKGLRARPVYENGPLATRSKARNIHIECILSYGDHAVVGSYAASLIEHKKCRQLEVKLTDNQGYTGVPFEIRFMADGHRVEE